MVERYPGHTLKSQSQYMIDKGFAGHGQSAAFWRGHAILDHYCLLGQLAHESNDKKLAALVEDYIELNAKVCDQRAAIMAAVNERMK